MTAPATTTRTLSTADARRETLLDAALPIFAAKGFHATSTVEVARAAGISQAYVFRLFPTKVDLYVAVCGVARERMLETFRAAAGQARHAGEPVMEAMGDAYVDFVQRDRDVLLVQIGSQVAGATEPQIADAARRCFADLYDLVAAETGATSEELQNFFAVGMLINTMTAIGADQIDEPWARTLDVCSDRN